MKSTKEVINDVIKKLSLKQKNEPYPSSDDNEADLTAFDLIPIHFTGMIQDYLFRQSQEIFDLLKEDNHHDIQGISFDEIRGDMTKNLYYEKVKENIPKYYALKAGKRQKHFKQEGQLYLKKMAIETKHIQSQNYPETEKKNLAKARQQTPMKLNKMSKKETKQQKKQQKKINCIKKPKDENQQSQQEPEQVKDQVFVTPKKQFQSKQVKFFQFQFVKDFSQYKTPKKLSCVQQVLEPLKQVQQIHNSEQ